MIYLGFFIVLISLIGPIIRPNFSVNAATTPLVSGVQTGFTTVQNAKPIRLSLSTDLIDFGPMTPTNPIKREINVSVDPGSSLGIFLLVSENHPLSIKDTVIPDTTCDTGACSEQVKNLWINPFTFGFGFSLSNEEELYQQFADASKKEQQTAIDPGKITIKLNVSQNQPPATSDNPYEITLLFLVIPKL